MMSEELETVEEQGEHEEVTAVLRSNVNNGDDALLTHSAACILCRKCQE